jgi:hypothetical protein
VQTSAQTLSVILTDITGRYIPLLQTSSTITERIFAVDNIAAGVYFAIINADNKITTQKLVIAR